MRDLVKKIRNQNSEEEINLTVDNLDTERLIAELTLHFRNLFDDPTFEFSLPADLDEFLKIFGQGPANFELPNGQSGALYDLKYVLSETKLISDVDFEVNRSRKEAWLVIGEYSDKHWYYICCDPVHPDFGKVADGEDTSPWNVHDSPDVEFDTFLKFLEYISG